MAQFLVTADGYFNRLLHPGDIFDGPEDMHGSWFTRIDAAKGEAKAADKLSALPIADLRIMAQNQGINFDKKTTKAELASLLASRDRTDEEEELA